MEEEYVILPQYPHYRIYRNGRVVREKYTRKHQDKKIILPEKEIKQHVGKNGYPALCVRNNNDKVVKVYTHRLVYEAYYGHIPDSMEVDHCSGDRTDLSCLRLVSHQDNCRNPVTIERYKKSNARDQGKYDKDRLVNATSKEYEENVIKIYLDMSEGGTKPVKIMVFMAQAHINFYRAKRIISLYSGDIN